ncbi:hypothetical protein L208DRAFT_1418246 [Tricholoma matsutake]|nr:hypothetical protein L208DRAFT_1418246 [Tricholoma matsutake 945]
MDAMSSLSEGFSHLSHDLSTDDDHRALDVAIMKTFSANRKINEEPNLASLLSNITAGDKRLISLLWDEAEDLLTHQPSINAVLQKAWKEGSFKEVWQLGAFCCSDKAPSTAQ